MFPIIDITQYLWKAVVLPIGGLSMKVYVHEYNSGALILARTFLPKFTSHSKYYATKNIWFCGEINKSNIVFVKIATVEQLWDLFAKVIPIAAFEYLRNKVIGC